MSTSSRETYHHGDLRTALLDAATELLEEGGTFSLRAVARRAEVSQTAPYRHFTGREALETAIAVRGFDDLRERFTNARTGTATISSQDAIADLLTFASTYILFALERPALFRLMFGYQCETVDDDRIRAAHDLKGTLSAPLHGAFPDSDHNALATALWSLTHGLAFLHLDGKLTGTSPEEIAAQVHATFSAILSAAGGLSARGTKL